MARLITAGFETGINQELFANPDVVATTITVTNGAGPTTSQAKNGNYSLACLSTQQIAFDPKATTNEDVFFWKFWLLYENVSGHVDRTIWKDSAAALGYHARLWMNTSGQLVCQGASDGVAIVSGTMVLTSGVWYEIQIEYKTSNTGYIKVWINGDLELSNTTDTKRSTVSQGKWELGHTDVGNNYYYDDIFLNDEDTSIENSTIPLGQKLAFFIVTSDGDLEQWTTVNPSTADHYTNVDEIPFFVGLATSTDRITSTTSGQVDLFNLDQISDDITSESTIDYIYVHATTTHSSAARQRGTIRLSSMNFTYGTDSGSNGTSLRHKYAVWSTNPSTSLPWINTELDSIQIGTTLTAAGGTAQLGNIGLYVEYITIPTINDNITLYMQGPIEQTDNITLVISGPIQITDNITLFINGHETNNDNITLFENGHVDFNDNINLFINGQDTESDNITLFIGEQIFLFNDNIDLYIQGPIQETDNQTLFTHGLDSENDNINLFVTGPIDSIKIEIFRQSVNTSSGIQDLIKTDFGLPKAALLFLSRSDTDGVSDNDACFSIGIVDSERQRSLGVSSAHGVTPTLTRQIFSSQKCILILDPQSGVLEASAELVEFIEDGIRINWLEAPSGAYLLNVILFGGENLNAYVNTFGTPAVVNNSINIGDPGFEPDQLICFGRRTGNEDVISNGPTYSLGLADNGATLKQRSVAFFSPNSSVFGEVAGLVREDYILSFSTLSTILNSAEITAFSSSGFTVFTRVSNGSVSGAYLALSYNDEVQHWIDTVQTPTSLGQTSFTGPGFKPSFVLQLFSRINTLNTINASDNAASKGIGIFTNPTEFSSTISENYGSNPTDTQSLNDNQAVNFPFSDGLSGVVASFVSMDVSGWTLDFSSVDLTSSKFMSLAVEAIPVFEINDNITLFIVASGETQSWNLYLEVGPNDLTNTIELFTYGSPSGTSFSFTSDDINLYLECQADEVTFPPQDNINNTLFLQVASGNFDNTGSWTLFLNSDTSISDSLDLRIKGHASGSLPNGIDFNDAITLFIKRIPDFPAQNGFTPTFDKWNLFLRVPDGSFGNITLFISGVPLSGILINNNINLFINGFDNIDEFNTLYIYGISGFIDNNITLYLDSIVNPDVNNVKLYTHGF